MNKDQLLGLSRELLTALGAALVTFGVQATGSMIETSVGAILIVISLFFAFQANEGGQIIATLVRKLFSAAGGVGVAFGLLTPEKLEALAAVVGPMIAIVWSIHSKGGTLPTGGASLILFFCLGLLSTGAVSSCAFSYDPLTGRAILRPDTETINSVVGYYARPVDVTDPRNPEWAYYDEETGELIDPKDYSAYNILEATK